MKNKNILYVLPIPKFFSKTNGVGGHIAHVYGIINGFKKADHNVNIISEESHHSLEQDLKKLQVIPKNNGFVWRFKILNSIRRACNESTDFCYMRYSASFSPWLLFVKFFLNSTPLILELNSVATQSHYWMRWLERFAINKADIIICVSDSFYHYIFQTFGKTISNKTLLVTNGVDAERFNKSVYKSDNVNKNYLGYVGILKKD